jgi:hypothetical protein
MPCGLNPCPPAMEGVWATYYLTHSLTDTKEYREQDVIVARSSD